MKNIIFIVSIMCLSMSAICQTQSFDYKVIKETILAFAKAGDTNDAGKLATYLDDNYRIIMNRLFGSNEVTTMTKAAYLEKIRTKEYGGENRKVDIESILLNGTIASAKASFVGTKMTFVSILTLIKDTNNQWKLVSDAPIVK